MEHALLYLENQILLFALVKKVLCFHQLLEIALPLLFLLLAFAMLIPAIAIKIKFVKSKMNLMLDIAFVLQDTFLMRLEPNVSNPILPLPILWFLALLGVMFIMSHSMVKDTISMVDAITF